MNRACLALCLLLGGIVLTNAGTSSSQNDDTFWTFWKRFKTAVIARDPKTVARLSKFPIAVAEGVPAIQNSAELNRRFSELFNRQTNAAKCFATKQPSPDTESPDRFTVMCPNVADNFVAYEFERTGEGWRFIHRQFPTKCRCR